MTPEVKIKVKYPPLCANGSYDHTYVYGGLRWRHGYQCAGSSAHEMEHWDWFFCEKCLHSEYRNKRYHGNSYQKPLEGSAPMEAGARVG